MFEYELSRVYYDHKMKRWIQDKIIGVYDTLDKTLNAQVYDRIETHDRYQYYVEYRVKLDYDNRGN